ncbi:MAG: type II secretion system protein [Fimbriimonas sp.]
MSSKKGFTLIELLVVIAIIAILAAIIFPVFARVKDNANRSSDMSNMNSIRTALQLYRADQGGYPPALLGYVTLYTSGVNAGNVIPANLSQGALYPKRVQSVATFRPIILRSSGIIENETSTAVWPTNLNRVGTSGNRNQRYAYPTDSSPVERCVDGNIVSNRYYVISGYDAATVKDNQGTRHELRYTLFWSGWSVAADPCNPTANESGSSQDDPRQLGYSEPPEDTVVTWNSLYRDYDNGSLARTKREMVLFLGGAARPFDSRAVADLAWQVKP